MKALLTTRTNCRFGGAAAPFASPEVARFTDWQVVLTCPKWHARSCEEPSLDVSTRKTTAGSSMHSVRWQSVLHAHIGAPCRGCQAWSHLTIASRAGGVSPVDGLTLPDFFLFHQGGRLLKMKEEPGVFSALYTTMSRLPLLLLAFRVYTRRTIGFSLSLALSVEEAPRSMAIYDYRSPSQLLSTTGK